MTEDFTLLGPAESHVAKELREAIISSRDAAAKLVESLEKIDDTRIEVALLDVDTKAPTIAVVALMQGLSKNLDMAQSDRVDHRDHAQGKGGKVVTASTLPTASALRRQVDVAVELYCDRLDQMIDRIKRDPPLLAVNHNSLVDVLRPWYVFDRANHDEIVGRFATREHAEAFAAVHAERCGGTVEA